MDMNYIIVRDAAGNLAAFLSPETDKIKDCFISKRLNEEHTLEFMLPMTSSKWPELDAECRIIADNYEFVILRPDAIDVQRDETGRVWGKVIAAGSWILMDKSFVTVSNDPALPVPPDLSVTLISGGPSKGGFPQGSAGSALSYLLEGSDWEVGTVDVTGVRDLETEKLSLLKNIQEVQKIWGGYLVWEYVFDSEGNVTNRKVHLRDESLWQDYNGFQVRYAKNLKNITKTANYDIVSKLYPFGENDLDIASVNDGVKYIENHEYTDRAYTGVYQNQGIYDPQVLKDEATKALAKICKPRFTYRLKVVDIRSLPEYKHEDYKLGDLVDVIDYELGINVQARIVRHRYNVFVPWQCELDIGEPEDRLAARLSNMEDVERFVREALRPNRATSNLLKGFINTFATTINSANGKLVWNDSTLEAIEVDGEGEETGNRVRITPGGVGISTDGGQSFVTAMTGAGILANTIIVNELYSLATDDGFTKLAADGLHVYDRDEAQRVHIGRWMDGEDERFGGKFIAADGSTVLVDDQGLMQTWQEGRADNLDQTYPLVLNLYLPVETRSIKRAILRFRRLPFRAYSKSNASGGDYDDTTASGGYYGDTTDDGGQITYTVAGWVGYTGSSGDYTYGDGGHRHGSAGSHNHGLATGNEWYVDRGNGPEWIEWTAHDGHQHSSEPDHTHALYLHGHKLEIDSHSHQFSVPNHTHEFSVPSHTHSINYGIYVSTTPTGITVKINGTDRTAALGGPFNSDQSNLEIEQYLSIGQWNTIELGVSSAQIGRLDATVFIQALIGV